MNYGSLKMIMQAVLLLLLVSGVSHTACAGPIEIQSIQILPAETVIGRHPEITGSIKVNTVKAPGKTVEINVIAVLARPDHVVKSWTWKNVRMKAGEIRKFSIPKEYEMKLAGSYRVDFNVYTRDMRPLHRLSRIFVAIDPSRPPEKTITPEDVARTDAYSSARAPSRPAEYQHLGVGVYANTLNSTGGATMLLWPLKNVGLQGSYTGRTLTIAEVRLLARFPLSSGINPYLGVGYLSATTEAEVIGIKTKFKDSGVSGVIGAEIPLSKSMFGYVEISGAAIDLKKEVKNGGQTAIATVKYAPVTVGIGIVYYLF
jgi:hypothetical protein